MNKYQRGKIYKITCNEEPDKMYIGSTCEPTLARRLSQHKWDYRKYLNGVKHFITSFEIVKYESATITLIEAFPCNTKDELLKKERYYIELYGGSINKVRPGRTGNEYRNDNKEKIKERDRKYHLNNKDKIKAYRNAKIECPCGSTTTNKHKTRHEKTAKHKKYLETL